MVIDVIVGAAVLACAVWSYHRGLLRKLAGIAALVIACLLAGLVGREIAHRAAERWDIQAMAALYVVCTILAWVLLFIVGRIVLGFLARRLGSDQEGRPAGWNRWLGGLFGAVQGLLLCWFVLAVLDAVPEDIRAGHLGPLHRAMEASPFCWLVSATNPAARLELQPLIDDVSAIAARPAVLRSLEREEVAQKLQANDKVKAILADEALIQEFKAGRLRRFFSDRRVRDALEDTEIRELLRQTDMRDAIRRLGAQARAGEANDERRMANDE